MLLEYVIRFIAGGLLVCLFALISEVCEPKQFAGIFCAAPSVLVAGILITLFTKGTAYAVLTAEGAIAGACGMIFYCIVATPAIEHYKTLPGSILSLAGWFLISFGVFALFRVVLGW